MELVAADRVQLEAEAKGTGDPVLLIHGAITPYTYRPLLAQRTLTNHYRLINYHRRGFALSSHSSEPVSGVEEAVDALALLRHFGIDRAHVVAHSGGGRIALQLALSAPEIVHSLTLLEGLVNIAVPEGLIASTPWQIQGSDPATVTARRLEASIGTNGRQAFDRELPKGWFDTAVADFDRQQRIFEPPVTQDTVRSLTQPILAVVGADTTPNMLRSHELFLQWLPQAESFVLPNATHALQVMNPQVVAEKLVAFWGRHPLKAVS